MEEGEGKNTVECGAPQVGEEETKSTAIKYPNAACGFLDGTDYSAISVHGF